MQMHGKLTMLVLLTLPAVTAPAWGQASPLTRPSPPDPVLSRLEFAGGSLLDYVRSVKKSQAEGEINLVINNTQWARRVNMPPVSLRNVSVGTALELVQYLAETGEYRAKVATHTTKTASAQQVYIVQIAEMHVGTRKPKSDEQPERRLEIFAMPECSGLGPGHPRLVGILTAIDEAMSLHNPSQKERAKVKFHSDSGIMLVFGTKEETRIIGEIVSRLSENAQQKVLLDTLNQEKQSLSQQLDRMTMERTKSEDDRARYEAKLRAFEEIANVRQAESEALQVDFRRILLMNEQLKAELASVKAQLDELQKQKRDQLQKE